MISGFFPRVLWLDSFIVGCHHIYDEKWTTFSLQQKSKKSIPIVTFLCIICLNYAVGFVLVPTSSHSFCYSGGSYNIYVSETEAPFSAHSFCFMISILIHIKIHRKAYLAGMEAYSRHIYWGVLLLFAWIQSLIDTYL